jgi:hypothetical protein
MSAVRFLAWVTVVMMQSAVVFGDVRGCICDPGTPASMEARECALTREVVKQPAGIEYFFLKDNNPRKPNRWLILPTGTGPAAQYIDRMPEEQRVKLWTAAIAKAKELFGDEWGLAYNAPSVRTQCHMHLHIGQFIKAAENNRYRIATRVEELPAPEDEGVWVHPVGKVMHVHYGELITETALVR